MLEFLNSIPHKFTREDLDLISRAFDFAQKAHEGQKRKSGEDYFSHCVQSAIILGQIFPDATTIAATLLHDVQEDTKSSLENIQKQFNPQIASLVDGVTKLGHVRLRNSKDAYYLENLRKMFLATSKDVRVILIKLADRLHNMRTIEFLPQNKQIKVAAETLEMYGPIANRLGIGAWRDQLEDLAFATVNPKEYKKTKELLDQTLKERDQNIKDMEKQLGHILRTSGIKFLEITGRIKRIYSLYKKLQKYSNDISKIYDIIALRIITRTTVDCYTAMGTVHTYFQPLPGRVKDYIATPKPNGYQSLHTTVFDSKGKVFEIQFRTDLMHEEAERGVAAHWFYSEEGKSDNLSPLIQAKWINELHAWQEESDSPDEFIESLKIDFFHDRIFVLTPKGDVRDLPVGASVIDFAFSVHSDLGYYMMGAKINGKMSSIYDELHQGDMIEIIKSKKPATISRDWLKAAKTSNARNKIRHYLAEHEKGLIQRIKELRNINLPTFFRKK